MTNPRIVYCAVDENDDIVVFSYGRITYFKTDSFLKREIERLSRINPGHRFRIAKFELKEVEYDG